ncbi:hypothetical protein ACFQGT_16970 [Natrialbaceae archaeon GCM10025810]|uniref:hypothetical protein n=1 Tax=Halovalidus salilacus TaxID=3075124 RepID=UPI003623EA21
MGRTNPTYRNAIRRLEREWHPMGEALRREYRDDFDRLFDRAREFADAAGYANPPDPERAFLLSLLLAHEVELRRLESRLEHLEAAASREALEADRSSTGPTEADERRDPDANRGE